MEKIIEGKVFVLGDNIDTDQIIPAEHLVYRMDDDNEAKLYGKYALSGVPMANCGLPEGNKSFIEDGEFDSEYKIIIAGGNFGCGSSREHAPYALSKAGVKIIIAESYARIFYRNSVDGGFVVPYQCREKLYNKFKTGDDVIVNVESNTIKNIKREQQYSLKPLGEVLPIVEAGGLFEYARQNSMI